MQRDECNVAGGRCRRAYFQVVAAKCSAAGDDDDDDDAPSATRVVTTARWHLSVVVVGGGVVFCVSHYIDTIQRSAWNWVGVHASVCVRAYVMRCCDDVRLKIAHGRILIHAHTHIDRFSANAHDTALAATHDTYPGYMHCV